MGNLEMIFRGADFNAIMVNLWLMKGESFESLWI